MWEDQYLSQMLPKERGPQPEWGASLTPLGGRKGSPRVARGQKRDSVPQGHKKLTTLKTVGLAYLQGFLDLNPSEGSLSPHFSGSLPIFSWIVAERPPRTLAGEDLRSHQPTSSIHVGPQRGFARWLYSAAHLPPKTQNQRAQGPKEKKERQ